MAKNFTQFSKAGNFHKPLPKGDFPIKQQSGSEVSSSSKPAAIKPRRDRVRPNEQVWVNGPPPKDGRKGTYSAKYARTGSLTEAEKRALRRVNEKTNGGVCEWCEEPVGKGARKVDGSVVCAKCYKNYKNREKIKESEFDSLTTDKPWADFAEGPKADWDDFDADDIKHSEIREMRKKKVNENFDREAQYEMFYETAISRLEDGESLGEIAEYFSKYYPEEINQSIIAEAINDASADSGNMDDEGYDPGGHYIGLERDLGRAEHFGESKKKGAVSPALREAIASYERKKLAESEEPWLEGAEEDFSGIDGGKEGDDLGARIESWLYNKNSGLMKTIVDGWIDRYTEYGTTDISDNTELEDLEMKDEDYILENLSQDLGIELDSETYDEYASYIWDFMIEAQEKAREQVGPIADMDVADFEGDKQLVFDF